MSLYYKTLIYLCQFALVATAQAQEVESGAATTMDHRALVEFRGELVTAGGMLVDQQTTNRVTAYTIRR